MLNISIICFINRFDLQYNKRQIKRVANPDPTTCRFCQEIAHLWTITRKMGSSEDTKGKRGEKK
jgi:hypothetical protein